MKKPTSDGQQRPKAESIDCPECRWSAQPVHRVAGVPQPVLKGWFCSHCGHFEKAILRERGLGIKEK